MRVLFVGLGGIGQRHLRNLRTLLGKDVEVLAWRVRGEGTVLGDRLQVEASSGLESTYGVTPVPSLDAGLERAPDAVFVCNPTRFHLPVVRAALEQGCHVFVEKPLGDTLDGVDDLIALSETAGLTTLVGYQLRFHPLFRRLKRMLEGQAIGPPLAARFEVGEYMPGWHPYEDYRRLYASRRELGGGVILSQIHELDLACWLFGAPTRVFAVAGHWTQLDIDVEDVASILLECRVGDRPLPVHVQQDFIQRPPSRTVEIVGEKGKVIVDILRNELRVFSPTSSEAQIERLDGYDRNELFLSELRHFLSCIDGEESSLVPLRTGAESLRVAIAALDSAATGTTVACQ